jgi:hypothetical protein
MRLTEKKISPRDNKALVFKTKDKRVLANVIKAMELEI